MLDRLAEFAQGFPAWLGQDGLPLTWWHYVVGLRHLTRKGARDLLRMEAAVAIASSPKRERQKALGEFRQLGGI